MNDTSTSRQAAERIRAAMERLRRELPQLATIFEAFEPLLVEHAALKDDLPSVPGPDRDPDPDAFAQGVPFLGKDDFLIDRDSLKKAVDRLGPALAKGFPLTREPLSAIKKAIDEDRVSPEDCFAVMAEGQEDLLETVASRVGVEPGVLRFVVGRFIKPFAEKRAESLAPFPENFVWNKGYCPVCGSWPELSFLAGKEGRRYLRCSFCGHEWGFNRLRCPFCDTEEQDKMELIFSKDRAFERAELCYECMKYVVGLDLRERIDVVREVAALGLVYLDVLAQEKGFEPGALCSWNIISGD
ncbi:MAG TPA: formate dehydrogenase accessory protein FdhE [Desulfomonilaceae bacterium]|nr:formate dehydrogenase accessory protein FdhE [Desulfomonilaceae bacterium]